MTKARAMDDRLAGRHVVLLGVGHTNAHVLRMHSMHPIEDADLTCISDHSVATYSGMLPAVLAGQVPRQQMEIDLVRLCSFANARLITDQVTGLDHTQRLIHFAQRPPIPFDVLSIGIGSVPMMQDVTVDAGILLKIKPMQTFLNRLADALTSLSDTVQDRPLRIVVVGAGVAGVEVTMCLPAFLSTHCSQPAALHLVTRSESILDAVIPSMRRRAETELQRRGVTVTTGRTVRRISEGQIQLDDSTTVPADIVLWATGAAPPPLLQQLGLPQDDRGFVLTDNTLQVRSHPGIFAVGDTGTIVSQQLPKAGVYAVRQGPILWDNIHHTLSGDSLVAYQPQRSFLKLLNTGDGSAIGEWKGISFSGRWVMKLKDRIDRRFMQMYQVPTHMMDHDDPHDAMQCKGCGCKLSADVLEQALTWVRQSPASSADRPAAALPDDAVQVGHDADRPLIASTDFFSMPFDDPWLCGRITALHASSDLVAMGARVRHALANIVLPFGDSRQQGRVLREFLAGANEEFAAQAATVSGGHTIVGPRMEAGFTVIGQGLGNELIRKSSLQPGDLLYLTKPLGIGILLAAHMRSQCPATAFSQLLQTMLQRQHQLAQIAVDHDVVAGTDITGFGLLGHLQEMLSASTVSAHIRLADIPMLQPAVELASRGIESTLAPDNQNSVHCVSAPGAVQQDSRYPLLFDPQTCGGLLLAVKPDRSQQFLNACQQLDTPPPACICEISTPDDSTHRCHIH
jgi:selenide,water dikinase